MLRSTIFFSLACALSAQTPASSTGKVDLQLALSPTKSVPGVKVVWTGPDNRTHNAVSGEDGHVHLFDLPAGVYRFAVQDPGYTVASSPAIGAVYVAADNTTVSFNRKASTASFRFT